MQKILIGDIGSHFENKDLLEGLKLRQRTFSLDQQEFPGLNEIEEVAVGKNASGVKMKRKKSSVVGHSTNVDSTNSNNEEPYISDESQESKLDTYMKKKDRMVQMAKRRSSTNVLVEAPVLLINWKLLPASFFELKATDQAEDE